MAMLFQACQNSSVAFIQQNGSSSDNASAQDLAFLHHKYLSHVVSELKPDLTEIIKQGIQNGEIHFDYPAALAEIVLIVIAVKLDNSLLPSTPKETEETLKDLFHYLKKGQRLHPEHSVTSRWCLLCKSLSESIKNRLNAAPTFKRVFSLLHRPL